MHHLGGGTSGTRPDRSGLLGSLVEDREIATHGNPASLEEHDTPVRVSWIDISTLLLRHRRLVVWIPLLFGMVTVALTLLAPKKYVTTVSFTPAAPGLSLPGGALSGIAGALGASLLGNDRATSPDFYASLLQTNSIMRSAIETKYTVRQPSTFGKEDTVTGTFIDLYEIDEGSPGRTTLKAINKLQTETVRISFDQLTSIVTVRVQTKWEDLSYQMAKRLLQLVDSFNIASQQQQAGAESRFLAARLDSVRIELRDAENALQAFLLRNRSYASDPALVAQFNRLQRELNLKQTLYSTITESFEQARLAAVHNTPSISLVEPPAPALRFERRHTLPKLLGAMFVGLILVMTYLVISDFLARTRISAPEEFSRMQTLLREARADLFGVLPRGRNRPTNL